jgi:hypothetical protein
VIGGGRVKRSRKGGVELRLPVEERSFLKSLAPNLRELFEGPADDPVLARLFPVAYPEDEDRQTEYRLLVHDELRQSLLAAAEVMEKTADAERLTPDEAETWMRALNHVRLVLGTRLEVTEEGAERPADRDDPRLPAFAAYDYLSYLQGELIEALGG